MTQSGLELDRPPPKRTASIEPADPSSFYPKKQTDWRWLQEGVKRTVGVVVVLGGLYVGWRVFNGKVPAPIASLLGMADRLADGEAINDDKIGVDCFTGAEGEYLTYDDEHGTANIVSSPAQVPAKFRSKARCIVLKK